MSFLRADLSSDLAYVFKSSQAFSFLNDTLLVYIRLSVVEPTVVDLMDIYYTGQNNHLLSNRLGRSQIAVAAVVTYKEKILVFHYCYRTTTLLIIKMLCVCP